MLQVKDLTTGAISKHLYQLALPIMGTSFVQMAYSFTDMAWLGRLGSEEVAAVGIISVFLWIANALTFLTKTGSEVLVGQAIGRKSAVEARSYASHNATISIVLGGLLTLIYAILAPKMVSLYRPEVEVSHLALEYMYIAICGLPAIFLTNTLFGIYNASGNSRVPFYVLSLGLICNMILDPLLIFGLDLGVAGAAWATVLSQWIVLIAFVIRLRGYDRLLGNFPMFAPLIWRESMQVFKIGLPPALLNILFAIITIYMGRLASSVGGHIAIAVLTTGGQLEALTWNTAQGATTALSTIVAQNYAAGAISRVWSAYRQTLLFTLTVGFLGMLYFVFGGEGLFSLIVPDAATYTEGAKYMRISGYSQMLMMLEITTQGLLYGVGLSYLPAGVSILGNSLRIPMALGLISLGLGVSSIWWAISLSAGLKGIISLGIILAYYYNQKKKGL